jgi:hypothetical protein
MANYPCICSLSDWNIHFKHDIFLFSIYLSFNSMPFFFRSHNEAMKKKNTQLNLFLSSLF